MSDLTVTTSQLTITSPVVDVCMCIQINGRTVSILPDGTFKTDANQEELEAMLRISGWDVTGSGIMAVWSVLRLIKAGCTS